jgi:hypothetical protein
MARDGGSCAELIKKDVKRIFFAFFLALSISFCFYCGGFRRILLASSFSRRSERQIMSGTFSINYFTGEIRLPPLIARSIYLREEIINKRRERKASPKVPDQADFMTLLGSPSARPSSSRSTGLISIRKWFSCRFSRHRHCGEKVSPASYQRRAPRVVFVSAVADP